jgi:hypothetical protein
MLDLSTAVQLLSQYVGANKEPKIQIYLACDYFLKCGDPVGSLERVTFTVTTDSTGQGFITLPDRYETIRGAVNNPTSTSPCGAPLRLQNDYYEFQPGNLGMLKGSDPMRGIIPIQLTQTDTTTYLDSGLVPRHFKVPACPTEGTITYFTLICKRASLNLTDDDAILPVWNLNALKYGLKALDKEDAEDYARADELWEKGKAKLADEKENQTGPEALGKVQMDDDFCLSGLGQEGWGGWGGYGYGDW